MPVAKVVINAWLHLKCTVLILCFMQLIDQHKDVLDETKAEYNKLKKTMDELRAAEVLLDESIHSFSAYCCYNKYI